MHEADHDLPIVVLKFGGSSVADRAHLRRVAKIVVARATTERVVVVVSAMGSTTNDLIDEAREVCAEPPPRELDMLLTTGERHCMAMLSLAIFDAGHRAISLTGSQCGILTTHNHGRARIIEVRPFRVLDELAAGQIVVVGGFQGVSYKREVTTLGRGGSDTTAVALAASLGASCEIYSDVDGIYSADPAKIDGARRFETVDYAEMQALARAGARVLHEEAVRLAAERDIVIVTRSTADALGGRGAQSVIRRARPGESRLRAVATDTSVATIRLDLAAPSRAAIPVMARALGGLGLRYLRVDVQGCSAVLSESQGDDVRALQRIFGQLAHTLGGPPPETGSDREPIAETSLLEFRGDLAMISCVCADPENSPEALGGALESLARANIEVHGAYSEACALSFVVDKSALDAGAAAIHASFAAPTP